MEDRTARNPFAGVLARILEAIARRIPRKPALVPVRIRTR
jgi:hypothetical protein